jgi:dihydrodipicolinate synthase/N-acetylneuraminate lyase
LIVGLACFGTVQAVEEARRMVAAGADALLVALPQYYATPIDGIIGHYDAIAAAVEIPILYYHFPSVTHLRISQDDFVRLADRVPIAGTKESGLSTPELRRRVANAPRPLSIFTGISFNILDALDAGAAGVICPIGGLMPDTTAQLLAAYAAGDREQASAAQERLRRAIPSWAATDCRKQWLGSCSSTGCDARSRCPSVSFRTPASNTPCLRLG